VNEMNACFEHCGWFMVGSEIVHNGIKDSSSRHQGAEYMGFESSSLSHATKMRHFNKFKHFGYRFDFDMESGTYCHL